MEYQLKRSKRKSISIQIRGDGSVLVRAPLRLSTRQIEAFLEEKRNWIEAQQARLAAMPAVEPLSPAALAELRKQAKLLIPRRVRELAPRVGVSYGQVSIRRQKTKWGSCSSRGNLNFNDLLLLAPPEVLDYVIIHELCHRREMNHSPRFWALVEQAMPDYRRARQWLRDQGGGLMLQAGLR